MPRPRLTQVTLVAIDTRAPALAAESLQRSMAQVDFGRVLLFTQGWAPPALPAGLEVVTIAAITSGADYSRFVLRQLPAHIDTTHVLITQWDGFVAHAAAWSDAFLQYDYIGSVWPEQAVDRCVGNGGFSLRSARLLAVTAGLKLATEHPEDEVLCRTQRALLEREHGIRFAPPELARRFAFENEAPRGQPFGFHGPYHLPRVLDEPTLQRWLAALPDAFFRSRDARRLARALLRQRMPSAARQLLVRRQAAGRRDVNTRALAAAARVLGWLSPKPG